MSKKLATHVHVVDDAGQAHVFGPGDKVPGWAKKQITNPKAWAKVADDEPETDESELEDDESDDDESESESESETTPDPAESSDQSEVVIPPKAGAGSSLEAWRAYAEANGFELDDDVKRDEIIAALEANNVPTE